MDDGIAFETERLRLRQWREADYAPFAALNADAQVMRYFPAPLTRVESDAMADHCRSLIAAKGWGVWVAERKADGDFLGFVGLHEPTAALPFAPCVEIAWRLARHAWGSGYATEAARGALAWGLSGWGWMRSCLSRHSPMPARGRSWKGSACVRMPWVSSIPRCRQGTPCGPIACTVCRVRRGRQPAHSTPASIRHRAGGLRCM